MVFSSDSFVVTNPSKTRAAFFVVQNYCECIRRLVLTHFQLLIRGAITTGNFYICDNILFGPAVVEAVSKDVSGYAPRILVSQKLQKEIELGQMYVFTDSDGELCLDMFGLELAESFASVNGKQNGEQKLKEELLRQRDYVIHLLKKYSKTKYVSKYLWHAMMFNQHVTENIFFKNPEMIREYLIDIPPVYLSATPEANASIGHSNAS